MPGATDFQEACRALALGVVMIAAFLGLRQWYERKGREEPGSADDAEHYRRQDVRRALGVGVMLALAAEVFFGSWVEPQIGGQGNPRFVIVWLVVLSLIILMLVLALVDWYATRSYGRRRRKALFREHIEELREEIHRRAAERRGSAPNGPREGE